MKKLVGIVTMIVLFSLSVNAQVKGNGLGRGSDLTTEQMATLQSKKMTLLLGLNENQQKDVYKMMLKSAEEQQKNRAEFRGKRQDGIKLTADERFNFENARVERQLLHKTEMKKILTKEQFTKWETEIMGKMYSRNKQNGDCNFQRNGKRNAPNCQFYNKG
ncbi:MAG: hypothetical protein WC389_11250 [Lutibacter sp.]|jgi:hypothetical protein